MRGWLAGDPQLAYLKHYVDNLFRKQAHMRSAEVEELLGSLAAPFANVEMTASMLTDADFKFPGATGSDGSTQPVTQGTLDKILAGADREARRTAWEGYMDTYLAYKNTLAANLLTSVKYNVFSMRARRHTSTLEMALAEHNTPVAVFHNLIATFQKNLPTWQRYWARAAEGAGRRHPPAVRHLGAADRQPAHDLLRAGRGAHLSTGWRRWARNMSPLSAAAAWRSAGWTPCRARARWAARFPPARRARTRSS